jgi:hypothetical protein
MTSMKITTYMRKFNILNKFDILWYFILYFYKLYLLNNIRKNKYKLNYIYINNKIIIVFFFIFFFTFLNVYKKKYNY